jgi:hypothetical protein
MNLTQCYTNDDASNGSIIISDQRQNHIAARPNRIGKGERIRTRLSCQAGGTPTSRTLSSGIVNAPTAAEE